MADAPAATRPARVEWKTSYGPLQLRDLLGLAEWQMDRLRAAGKLAPDLDRGRWSTDAAKRLYRRRARLAEQAGSIPDIGVWRAAEYLGSKFGIEKLDPDAVVELVARGHIPWAGFYKKNRLVSGLALERFDNREAVEKAQVDGCQVKTEQVAAILEVRPIDVTHLVDKGHLRPVDYYQGQWNSYVALYRYGDLVALLADDSYDWDAVRAVPAGRPSLFAKLAKRVVK